MASGFLSSLHQARFLLGSVPLFAIATTALFPLVALELASRGFTADTIGAVTSLYYFGASVGVFSFRPILARLGQKQAIALAAMTAGGAAIGLGATEDPAILVVLRFFTGYGLGAYYLVMDSWVSSLATKQTRGRLFATHESIRLAGTAAGPLLLVVGNFQSGLFMVAGLFAVSVLPVLFSTPTEVRATQRIDMRKLIALAGCFRSPLTLIACGAMANSSFYALGPLYGKGLGMNPTVIALFTSSVLLAPAPSGLPVGALADRFTRMRTAACVCFGALGFAALLAVSDAPPHWLAGAGAALVGAGMVTLYALGLSRIVDSVGKVGAVDAALLAILTYNLGSFCGPILSGFAMQMLGPQGLYVAIGGFALTALVAALIDCRWATCCVEAASPA